MSRSTRGAAPVAGGARRLTQVVHRGLHWRGMRDLVVTRHFLESGDGELAPMSATADLDVAVRAARWRRAAARARRCSSACTTNIMQRGAQLAFLSVTPHEKEFLYPPLTYLKPTGLTTEITFDDVTYTVIDVVPHFRRSERACTCALSVHVWLCLCHVW